MFGFRKKTREEQMAFRTSAILTELTSKNDFEFTDLETVQILNDVRRRFIEHLNQKKIECEGKSLEFSQRANELQNVIELILQ